MTGTTEPMQAYPTPSIRRPTTRSSTLVAIAEMMAPATAHTNTSVVALRAPNFMMMAATTKVIIRPTYPLSDMMFAAMPVSMPSAGITSDMVAGSLLQLTEIRIEAMMATQATIHARPELNISVLFSSFVIGAPPSSITR